MKRVVVLLIALLGLPGPVAAQTPLTEFSNTEIAAMADGCRSHIMPAPVCRPGKGPCLPPPRQFEAGYENCAAVYAEGARRWPAPGEKGPTPDGNAWLKNMLGTH